MPTAPIAFRLLVLAVEACHCISPRSLEQHHHLETTGDDSRQPFCGTSDSETQVPTVPPRMAPPSNAHTWCTRCALLHAGERILCNPRLFCDTRAPTKPSVAHNTFRILVHTNPSVFQEVQKCSTLKTAPFLTTKLMRQSHTASTGALQEGNGGSSYGVSSTR